MSSLAPCCDEGSDTTTRVRAVPRSPAYAQETVLRDRLSVSRRSLLLVALAGALAGILSASLDGVASRAAAGVVEVAALLGAAGS